jgi:hypothetical protein
MDKVYFIFEGEIIVKGKLKELVRLPKYSWFGDYQVLLGCRSNVSFHCYEGGDTYSHCVNRQEFIYLCS